MSALSYRFTVSYLSKAFIVDFISKVKTELLALWLQYLLATPHDGQAPPPKPGRQLFFSGLSKKLKSIQNIKMNYFLFVIFFSFYSLALKVIIDPGHGGADRGAVYGKAQESKLVFEISKYLKEDLERNHHSTDLTRSKDEFISLKKRVAFSEQAKGDLFISIHANASEDRRAKGIEFFLQSPQTNSAFSHKELTSEDLLLQEHKNKTEPISLSKKEDIQNIVTELNQNIKLKRSFYLSSALMKDLPGIIKQAPFFVLTKTQIPSILVEVGFLSHPKDNMKLLRPDYQKQLAQKIYGSIQNYAVKINPPLTSTAKSLDDSLEIPK